MAEHIASLPMSVFVMDYDHNAPTVQHLIETHERFYRIVREKNPELPIVFITAPNVYHRPTMAPRRTVIMENYTRLREEDKNLYFIDGTSFFQGTDADYCTVDGCHPTDYGFYRMAMGILPTLKRALKL